MQKHEVQGYIHFPIVYSTYAFDKAEANEKAKKMFNSYNVVKLEIDCHTRNGKVLFIIANENITIDWRDNSDENI